MVWDPDDFDFNAMKPDSTPQPKRRTITDGGVKMTDRIQNVTMSARLPTTEKKSPFMPLSCPTNSKQVVSRVASLWTKKMDVETKRGLIPFVRNPRSKDTNDAYRILVVQQSAKIPINGNVKFK